MKTTLRLFTVIALFALSLFASAQTSDLPFSFQGYAIDPDGKSLGSTGITVKFTITGPSVTFEEEHALTSDAFGVFHAVIGNSSGAKKLEFSKLNFTTIDPANPVYFSLKVEVKKTSGGSYTTISDAPMNAVPYARHAANGVPVGTIIAYGGALNKIPYGWVLCDGSSKDGTTAQWKQLFEIIGIAWGGSGTTFILPDLRGQFLRGVDMGRGLDEERNLRAANAAGGNTGDNIGTVQWDQFRSHSHNFSYLSAAKGAGNTPNCEVDGCSQPPNGAYNGRTKIFPDNHGSTTGGTGGGETRPDNAAVYYIIKY